MKTMMKLRSLLVLLFICNTSLFNAQLQEQTHRCGFDHVHNQQLQNNPAYRMQTEQFNELVQNFSMDSRSGTTLKIPVVVHVMSTGTSLTEISDQQIKDAIKNMNQMFRKVPGTKGDGAGVDVDIEFALAVRDPNGNCTNGITRFDMTGDAIYMANGVFADEFGISDAALKAYTSWDQTLYYNIWLVSEIDNNGGGAGIQGYAFFASSHGAANDGAVILVSNFKNPESTTGTHEIGHALNVYHTFEGDGTGGSCPANTTCATQGDRVCDTPPHRRSTSNCNTGGTNACDGGSSNLLFVRNYMDYSSDACQNMFTDGQKTRMVAALTTQRASFLAENGNMALVPVGTPEVDFSADRQLLCGIGQSIQFYDLSSCIPNTYLADSEFSDITFEWTVTNGTNTYTATTQNPSIIFAHTGTFDVSLEVTTLLGVFSLTKQGMIVVSAAPAAGCIPTSSNPSANYGFTVNRVQLNTLDNSTSTGVNGVYQDFSCTDNTVISSLGTHSISVTIRSSNGTDSQFFEAYIDFNNDGVFTHPGELIGSGSVLNNTSTVTSNFTVPVGAVKNTLLRMRIYGDVQATNLSRRTCASALAVADVEDYGVYISDNVASVSIAASPGSSISYGNNVTFTATPVNEGSSPTFAWYVNGELQVGETSDTYENNTLINGDEVHCVLTSSLVGVINSPAQSNTVTMTVVGPPISDFSANLVAVCQGSSIQFTDESVHVPTAWSWTFTGGTASSLSVQNPTVTYATPGVYAVTLTASNGLGTGTTVTKTGYITVYASPQTTCNVTRSAAPAAGIGITNVKLNTINHNTVYDGAVVNNYSCSQITTLQTSTLYTVSVTVGSQNNQWVRAYIDYNNNGVFTDPGEQIFAPTNGIGIRSGSFTTPANPTLNTLLKMRVISDFVNTSPGSCTSPLQYGQVEEYGIVIQAPCIAPTVDATSPSARCDAGILTLSASPSAGIIKWYTQATLGTALVDDVAYDLSGNSLTINNLTSTTTFYAEAVNGTCVSTSRTAVTATVYNCQTAFTSGCNTTLNSVTDAIAFSSVSGAQEYRVRIQHAGTGYSVIGSAGTNTFYRLSWLTVNPVKYGTTYTLSVAAKVGGIWGDYSAPCLVTTPPTRLKQVHCLSTLTALSDQLNFESVAGALEYRVEIRLTNTNALVVVGTQSNPNFPFYRLSWISPSAYTFLPATSYTLRVSARVESGWQPYGPGCAVIIPIPQTQLASGSCNVDLPTMTSVITANPVQYATGYRYEFRLASNNTLVGTGVFTGPPTAPLSLNNYRLSWRSGLQSNTLYTVRVAALINGIWGNYGPGCTVRVVPSGGLVQEENNELVFNEQRLTVYPNPNNGTFTASASQPGEFFLLNSLGQIIQHISLTEENLKIEITNLSSGMYFLSGTVDGQQLVEKIVVK
jgi:PKD repeat protein